MNTYTNSALQQALVDHQEFVRRLAARLTHDPAEADDVAQDVWVRAIETAAPAGRLDPGPDESRGPRPWLQASVRGIVKNRGRAARRRRFHEQAGSRSEVQPMRDLELRQEVVAAVLALEEPFRSTVVKTYELGMSAQEIAELEGVAPGTIRTRLHRAHRKLRVTLCRDDEQRSRVSVLAHAAPALPALASKSSGLSVGLGLAAAMAACGGLVWWFASLPSEEQAHGGAVYQQARLAGPQGLTEDADLASVATRTIQAPKEKEKQQARVPLIADEHPYWAAVRAARNGVPSYEIDEPAKQAALRSRVSKALVSAPEWLPGEPLGEMLSRVSKEAGVPVRASVEASSAVAPTEPQWLNEPVKIGFSDWLDLTLALAEPRPQWEIQDGAVRVADLSELLEHAIEFEYRLDDFEVDPEDFFDGREVPAPVYGATLAAGGIASSLADELGDLFFREYFDVLEAAPAAFKVPLTPRGHLRVQAGLDRLRSFRIPLPGKGVPGGVSRPASPRSHRRAYALLRGAGGVSALAALGSDELTETLRVLGKKQGIGVLSTAAARERLSQPGPSTGLIFEVIGGCVCVFVDGERASRSKQVLWMDLRETLDGSEFDTATIAATPHLEELRSRSKPLVRSLFLPASYCHRFIAPESWDSDPDYQIRTTEDGWLIVKHRPWVLDEIERVMNSWRPNR